MWCHLMYGLMVYFYLVLILLYSTMGWHFRNRGEKGTWPGTSASSGCLDDKDKVAAIPVKVQRQPEFKADIS